jgi:hypothetical protein
MEGYEYAMAEQWSSNGKVKTMSPIIAEESNLGIAVRTIKEFYKQKSKIKDHLKDKFLFYVSFFQIYNENVYDLLNFEPYSMGIGGGRKYMQN